MGTIGDQEDKIILDYLTQDLRDNVVQVHTNRNLKEIEITHITENLEDNKLRFKAVFRSIFKDGRVSIKLPLVNRKFYVGLIKSKLIHHDILSEIEQDAWQTGSFLTQNKDIDLNVYLITGENIPREYVNYYYSKETELVYIALNYDVVNYIFGDLQDTIEKEYTITNMPDRLAKRMRDARECFYISFLKYDDKDQLDVRTYRYIEAQSVLDDLTDVFQLNSRNADQINIIHNGAIINNLPRRILERPERDRVDFIESFMKSNDYIEITKDTSVNISNSTDIDENLRYTTSNSVSLNINNEIEYLEKDNNDHDLYHDTDDEGNNIYIDLNEELDPLYVRRDNDGNELYHDIDNITGLKLYEVDRQDRYNQRSRLDEPLYQDSNVENKPLYQLVYSVHTNIQAYFSETLDVKTSLFKDVDEDGDRLFYGTFSDLLNSETHEFSYRYVFPVETVTETPVPGSTTGEVTYDREELFANFYQEVRRSNENLPTGDIGNLEYLYHDVDDVTGESLYYSPRPSLFNLTSMYEGVSPYDLTTEIYRNHIYYHKATGIRISPTALNFIRQYRVLNPNDNFNPGYIIFYVIHRETGRRIYTVQEPVNITDGLEINQLTNNREDNPQYAIFSKTETNTVTYTNPVTNRQVTDILTFYDFVTNLSSGYISYTNNDDQTVVEFFDFPAYPTTDKYITDVNGVIIPLDPITLTVREMNRLYIDYNQGRPVSELLPYFEVLAARYGTQDSSSPIIKRIASSNTNIVLNPFRTFVSEVVTRGTTDLCRPMSSNLKFYRGPVAERPVSSELFYGKENTSISVLHIGQGNEYRVREIRFVENDLPSKNIDGNRKMTTDAYKQLKDGSYITLDPITTLEETLTVTNLPSQTNTNIEIESFNLPRAYTTDRFKRYSVKFGRVTTVGLNRYRTNERSTTNISTGANINHDTVRGISTIPSLNAEPVTTTESTKTLINGRVIDLDPLTTTESSTEVTVGSTTNTVLNRLRTVTTPYKMSSDGVTQIRLTPITTTIATKTITIEGVTEVIDLDRVVMTEFDDPDINTQESLDDTRYIILLNKESIRNGFTTYFDSDITFIINDREYHFRKANNILQVANGIFTIRRNAILQHLRNLNFVDPKTIRSLTTQGIPFRIRTRRFRHNKAYKPYLNELFYIDLEDRNTLLDSLKDTTSQWSITALEQNKIVELLNMSDDEISQYIINSNIATLINDVYKFYGTAAHLYKTVFHLFYNDNAPEIDTARRTIRIQKPISARRYTYTAPQGSDTASFVSYRHYIPILYIDGFQIDNSRYIYESNNADNEDVPGQDITITLNRNLVVNENDEISIYLINSTTYEQNDISTHRPRFRTISAISNVINSVADDPTSDSSITVNLDRAPAESIAKFTYIEGDETTSNIDFNDDDFVLESSGFDKFVYSELSSSDNVNVINDNSDPDCGKINSVTIEKDATRKFVFIDRNAHISREQFINVYGDSISLYTTELLGQLRGEAEREDYYFPYVAYRSEQDIYINGLKCIEGYDSLKQVISYTKSNVENQLSFLSSVCRTDFINPNQEYVNVTSNDRIAYADMDIDREGDTVYRLYHEIDNVDFGFKFYETDHLGYSLHRLQRIEQRQNGPITINYYADEDIEGNYYYYDRNLDNEDLFLAVDADGNDLYHDEDESGNLLFTDVNGEDTIDPIRELEDDSFEENPIKTTTDTRSVRATTINEVTGSVRALISEDDQVGSAYSLDGHVKTFIRPGGLSDHVVQLNRSYVSRANSDISDTGVKTFSDGTTRQLEDRTQETAIEAYDGNFLLLEKIETDFIYNESGNFNNPKTTRDTTITASDGRTVTLQQAIITVDHPFCDEVYNEELNVVEGIKRVDFYGTPTKDTNTIIEPDIDIEDDFDTLFPVPIFDSRRRVFTPESVQLNYTTTLTNLTPETRFSIVGGVDADLFTINDRTGVIQFRNIPDFEQPQDTDRNNEYDIVVRASNALRLDAQTDLNIKVIVTNVNETIEFLSQANITIPHGNVDVYKAVTITDVETINAVYRFARDTNRIYNADLFTIDRITGQVSFIKVPDFIIFNEGDTNPNVYRFTIIAETELVTETLLVTVTLVSAETDPPVFEPINEIDETDETNETENQFNRYRFTLLEDTTNIIGEIHLEEESELLDLTIIGGIDRNLFRLNPETRMLSFTFIPDYEYPRDQDEDNLYNVVIRATDIYGNTATQQYIVEILNNLSDDDTTGPVFTGPLEFSIYENIAEVGTINVIDRSPIESIKIIGNDQDSRSLQLINRNELVFRFRPDFENPRDANRDNIFNITIEAVDRFNNSTRADISVTILEDSTLSPEDRVAVNIPDNDLTDPVFVGPTIFTILEETTATAGIINIEDVSPPVSLNIIGGVDRNLFTINRTTNALEFKTIPDYENPTDADMDNQYHLTIEAVDSVGNRSVEDFRVDVTDDENDNVVFTGPFEFSIFENHYNSLISTNTIGVINVDASGPLTIRVVSDDLDKTQSVRDVRIPQPGMGPPEILITQIEGVIRALFSFNPDYENPVDNNRDNIYNFTLEATLSSGRTVTQAFVVNVLDHPDDIVPRIVFREPFNLTIREGTNTPFDIDLSEARFDNRNARLSLRLLNVDGNDSDLFTIDRNSRRFRFRDIPIFDNPRDMNRDNIYTLRILAVVTRNDAVIQRETQDYTVTVERNFEVSNIIQPPVIIPPFNFYIIENTRQLVSTISVDNGASPFRFRILGRDKTAFRMVQTVLGDPSTANRLAFRSLPSFSNPIDSNKDNIYNITLELTDTLGYKTKQDYIITVLAEGSTIPDITDENLPGPILSGKFDYTILDQDRGGTFGPRKTPHQIASMNLILTFYKGPITYTLSNDIQTNRTASNVRTGANGERIEEQVVPNLVFSYTRLFNGQISGRYVTSNSIDSLEDGINKVLINLSFNFNHDIDNPIDTNEDNIYETVLRITDGNNRVTERNIRFTIVPRSVENSEDLIMNNNLRTLPNYVLPSIRETVFDIPYITLDQFNALGRRVINRRSNFRRRLFTIDVRGGRPPYTYEVLGTSNFRINSVSDIRGYRNSAFLEVNRRNGDVWSSFRLDYINIPNRQLLIPIRVCDSIGGCRTEIFVLNFLAEDGSSDIPNSDIPSESDEVFAHAGLSRVTLVNRNVVLDGAGSSGRITSFEWVQLPGLSPRVNIINPNYPRANFIPTEPNDYAFQLTVRDNNGSVSRDYVVITALRRELIVDAGPDVEVARGLDGNFPVINLDASNSSDPNGGDLTYQWSLLNPATGAVINNPNQEMATLDLSSVRFLIYEAFTVILTATSSDGLTGTDSLVVRLTPSRNPISNPGPHRTVTTGTTVTLDGSDSFDPDGEDLTYKWTRATGPVVPLSNPEEAITTFIPTEVGSYIFRLTVTDPGGLSSVPQAVLIRAVAPANRAPVAIIVNPRLKNPTSRTVINLNGSGSTDPDNDTLTYNWTWSRTNNRFPDLTINNSTSDIATVTIPTIPFNIGSNIYTFTLTVTDPDGLTGTSSITVPIISSVNRPPISNAGPDRTVTTDTTVTLNGSRSFDPDGTISTYRWHQVSGTGPGIPITDLNEAIASITPTATGLYVFQLTVTDDNGLTDNDSVRITVVAPPNRPPVARAGQDQSFTIGQNSTITLDGSGSSDPDGNTLTYSWSLLNTNVGAVINNPTSEMPTLDVSSVRASIYQRFTVRLTVTDTGGATDSDDVVITINNSPLIADAGPDRILNVRNPFRYSLSGLRSRGGLEPYTYRWTGPLPLENADKNFTLIRASRVRNGSYTFTLTVTDSAGQTDTDQITLTLNFPPIARAGSDQISITGTELTLDGSASSSLGSRITTYRWTQLIGPNVTINNANQSRARFTPTESGTYIFRLTVTDVVGLSDTDQVTITVNNQPPSANAGSDESSFVNYTVTLDGSGSTTTSNNVTIVSYNWRQISGPQVSINNFNLIRGSFRPTRTGTYRFRLTIMDSNRLMDTDDITITVIEKPNNYPIANAGNGQSVIVNNTVTLNGSRSSDPDGDALTYSWRPLGWPSANQRPVLSNPNSVGPTFTPNSRGTYVFRLTVTDTNGLSDTDEVHISATERPNRPPVANAGPDQPLIRNLDRTFPIITLDGSRSSDPDGDNLTYRWSVLNPVVSISNPNVSQTTATITPGVTEGIVPITLTVTDPDGLSNTDTVRIILRLPDNRAPIANAGPDQTLIRNLDRTFPIITLDGSRSSDPDGDALTYVWNPILPNTAKLNNPTSVRSTYTPTVPGSYRFRLTVRDPRGLIDTDDVTIVVTERPNRPPVANAGPDQRVTVNSTITLDGSRSFDPDGDNLTYRWTQLSGFVVDIINSNSIRASFRPNPTGPYVFRLTVTDSRNRTSSDTVTVTVFNRNPIANAGTDIIGHPTESLVILNGSGSYDPDGGHLRYSWSQTSGPRITLSNYNAIGPTFTPKVPGTYRFNLIVSDNYSFTSVDSVTITVIWRIPPPPVLINEQTTSREEAYGWFGTDRAGEYAHVRRITVTIQTWRRSDGTTYTTKTAPKIQYLGTRESSRVAPRRPLRVRTPIEWSWGP